MHNPINKKIAISIVVVAAIIVSFGVFSSAPKANATFLDDLFKNFIAPFTRPATSTAPAQNLSPSPATGPSNSAVPLYKPVIDYESAVVAAVKKVSPAVVSITVSKNVPKIEQCPYDPFGDLPPEFRQYFNGSNQQFTQPCQNGTELQEVGSGSGFIISSDGLILTNKHVVFDKSASYTVFTNDGKKYDAKVLARDSVQDLAVVKIIAAGLPTVELGDSNALELGQTAIAIGNALGEYRNTVSVGVISGLARTVTASGADGLVETIHGVIQTDAAINPGNSGGPLLNLRGEVIGIDTAVASNAQSIGFAIPINFAKKDIQSVRTTGDIQTPFLGVRYLAITPDIAKKEKLPVGEGALVRGSNDGPAIEPGSPAAKAGIQAEDIIIAVNGVDIDESHLLGTLIAQFNVGDTVTLTINRGGTEVRVNVTLAKRPS